MNTTSHLSTILLVATLAITPALAVAQKSPTPETAIPRHTRKGGNGNFAPPRNRKLPPDPHHDIPAHPNHAKHARDTKKDGSVGQSSSGSAAGGGQKANPQ